MDSHHDYDGGGLFGMMGGIQMMGIVNALKTGNVVSDMLLAMCIPVVLRLVFSSIDKTKHYLFNPEKWTKWWHSRFNKYQRFITYESTRSHYGDITPLDNDTRNTVLLKAIQLYLHHKCNLQLSSANVNLTSMESNTADYGCDYGDYYNCYDDSEATDGGGRKTLVGVLSKYKVIKKPPTEEWHKIGFYYGSSIGQETGPKYVVQLQITETEEPTSGAAGGNKDNAGASKHETVYHFVSPGQYAIDTFINTAFEWYMDELRKLEDNSRFYYDLQMQSTGASSSSNGGGGCFAGDSGDGRQGGMLYKRYRLSDEKTFDSLFFQEKESLLKLVQHFTDKSGKYAIKGYPHKMGLLLHGPPGTGKTSLIKALAERTGRSIVNVPLSRVSTNSELMSIFFDQTYNIGQDVPVKLDFKDVIFVMEDVDAASKVVKRRDGKKTHSMTLTEHVDLPFPKSIWRMLLESTEADCQELVQLLIKKSDRLKKEATSPEMLKLLAMRMMEVPGLGLVGTSTNKDNSGGSSEALRTIGDEAIESANQLMDKYSTVDRFMSTHARSIKSLLDAGAEVDDAFVDELLGLTAAQTSQTSKDESLVLRRGVMQRDLSYSKDSVDEKEFHVESAKDAMLAHFADSMLAGEENEKYTATAAAAAGGGASMKPENPFLSTIGKDKLNLMGLLNVLDGVVDTPGRILIMTTNHPEMLDPALIRPGRIDKKLSLGYMSSSDVICMLEHYFQVSLDDTQKGRVIDAIEGNAKQSRPKLNLTPAQVEQLTAEYDDMEDMIAIIEEKGCVTLPKMSIGTASMAAVRYNC